MLPSAIRLLKQLSTACKNQGVKTLICACIFAFFISNSATSQVNKQDSLALVDLYNSTDGKNWIDNTNWLTSAPVSQWHGVTVSGQRVTRLFLNSNDLHGTLPLSIGDLTAVTFLQLDFNDNLTGTIPSTIGNLSSVQTLDLSYNPQLSGSIPASIGQLSTLRELNIQNNHNLTGSIPSSVGNLLNLKVLSFQYDQLTGTIPASIGNLRSLETLSLSGNQISGSIPTSIGNLTALIRLWADQNQLSDSIPASLQNLKNLYWVNLSNNKFTFAGMEGIAQQVVPSYKEYAPQALIPIKSLQCGKSLSVSVGGTPANNTYHWYKDNALQATIKADSTFATAMLGKYYVVVNNAIAAQLTLYSDTVVVGATMQSETHNICAGEWYTLPSGKVVNTAGTYRDTLRNRSGCDSLITTLTLTINSIKQINTTVHICADRNYVLPSGKIVNTTGTYYDTLRSKSGCDSVTAVISLIVHPLPNIQQLHTNVVLCKGGLYVLPSGKKMNEPGVYVDTLQGIGGCDSIINTVSLSIDTSITLTDTTIAICKGAQISLTAGPATGKYIWNTGATSGIITTNHEGLYTVSATGILGCIAHDTFNVVVHPTPTLLSDNDTIMCKGQTKDLHAKTGYQSYLWNTGGTTSTITVDTAGRYWLRVVDNNNCTFTDTVVVEAKNCLEVLYIPNAFTPNNDGRNDVFKPVITNSPDLAKYSLAMFNRFGQRLFTSYVVSKGWDGTIAGVQQASGVYIWVLQYQLKSGEVKTAKGTVLLLR